MKYKISAFIIYTERDKKMKRCFKFLKKYGIPLVELFLITFSFMLFTYWYIKSFPIIQNDLKITSIETSTETMPVKYTYDGYYLNNDQYLYKSQYHNSYYSDVDMGLKQDEQIVIDTIVTSQNICISDAIGKCDYKRTLTYLACKDLNIKDKIRNKEFFYEKSFSELFPLLHIIDDVDSPFRLTCCFAQSMLYIVILLCYICLAFEIIINYKNKQESEDKRCL